MALLFNAYVLTIGVAVIADGIRGQRLREASSGLTLIAVLVLLRFFGGEWSFVVRGIPFVIVGLAFLAANFWLGRQVRARSEERLRGKECVRKCSSRWTPV